MNVQEFLKTQGQSKPLHPVVVKAVDPADPSRTADVPAVLRFVPDRLAVGALDSANRALAKLDAQPTSERRAIEEAYHLVALAVRDADNPDLPLFSNATDAQSHLVRDEAVRLRDEYQRYVDTHFPPAFTNDEARRLAEEAKTFFLSDLLSRYGYWQILRALPFLAIASGASLTPTSSLTGSAST